MKMLKFRSSQIQIYANSANANPTIKIVPMETLKSLAPFEGFVEVEAGALVPVGWGGMTGEPWAVTMTLPVTVALVKVPFEITVVEVKAGAEVTDAVQFEVLVEFAIAHALVFEGDEML